jgi:hypothetical protein
VRGASRFAADERTGNPMRKDGERERGGHSLVLEHEALLHGVHPGVISSAGHVSRAAAFDAAERVLRACWSRAREWGAG